MMKKLGKLRTVCRFAFGEMDKSKARTSSDELEDCSPFINATPENEKFKVCLHLGELGFTSINLWVLFM